MSLFLRTLLRDYEPLKCMCIVQRIWAAAEFSVHSSDGLCMQGLKSLHRPSAVQCIENSPLNPISFQYHVSFSITWLSSRPVSPDTWRVVVQRANVPVPDDYATAKTEVTVRGTCGIDFSGISNKLGVLRPVNHYHVVLTPLHFLC